MARAMKDPFPPARMAALRALQGTTSLHDAEDVATKVIPMVSPLAVDGVQDVRIAAVACLDEFVKVVKEHEEKIRVDEVRPGSGGATGAGMATIDSGSMRGVHIETGGGEGYGFQEPQQEAQQFQHARDVSDIPERVSEALSKPAAAEVAGAYLEGSDRNESSTGWMEDDDVLEDMLDAAAAEREARSRLNALSLKKPAGVKAGAARERPVRAAGSTAGGAGGAGGVGAASKPKAKPMKLGAKKIEQNDDDFEDW